MEKSQILFTVSNIHDKIILLGSFKDQVMTAKYEDKSEFLLIQWHPPYTEDGEQLLEKFYLVVFIFHCFSKIRIIFICL